MINAARGGIVDEAALYDALVSGKVMAQGLTCSQRSRRTPPIRCSGWIRSSSPAHRGQ
jgi:hypothetical protein